MRRFQTDAPMVLFSGSNGIGKTNCLEALSFLVSGRGLRHVKMEEILPQHQGADSLVKEMGWGVQAQITPYHQKNNNRQNNQQDNQTNNLTEQSVKIATGFNYHFKKRHIIIDGVKQSSQQVLDNYVRMLWYLPQMARLFQDGRSGRLRLIDRIAGLFDKNHYGRLQSYEQQMRERLLLLISKGDDTWLETLEHEMAMRAISIATTRKQMILRLNQFGEQPPIAGFPSLRLELQSGFEEKIFNESAAHSEEHYRQKLHAHRANDVQENRTHFGIHRSDIVMFYQHDKQELNGQLCSTGEQKMMMMTLILAQLQLLLQEKGRHPILLLDDIIAHLDKDHLGALLAYLQHMNVQLFLTGTDDNFLAHLSLEYLQYRLDYSA